MSKNTKSRLIITGLVVGAGIIAVVASGPDAPSTSTPETTSAAAVETTFEAPVATADALTENGVWKVNADILPGLYRVVPEEGWDKVPYWARCADLTCSLSGSGGMAGAVIDNAMLTGPGYIAIEPTDVAVELRDVTLTPAE